MDLNITTDEVVAVFPNLELPVRQAVFIAVLERRNGLLQAELEGARRSINNYETFVKQGDPPKPKPDSVPSIPEVLADDYPEEVAE